MAVLSGYVTPARVDLTLCCLKYLLGVRFRPADAFELVRKSNGFVPIIRSLVPPPLYRPAALGSAKTMNRCFVQPPKYMQSLRIAITRSVELTGATIRDAQLPEIGLLAKLWFDGWQDAHARIVPAELARVRTLPSFEDRLRRASARLRVALETGTPVGFYILKGDELYQFYVSSNARGSGVAAVLMADAETHLRERGVHTAWLACAVGNDRAARFYEKCGWIRTGTVTDDVEVPDGTFPLEVWRYEKSLR